MATLFKFGYRARFRARYIVVAFRPVCDIRQARTSLPAYVQHRFPVGRHMENAAQLRFTFHQFGKRPERSGAYYDALCATGQGKTAAPCSRSYQIIACSTSTASWHITRRFCTPSSADAGRRDAGSALQCRGNSAPARSFAIATSEAPIPNQSPA